MTDEEPLTFASLCNRGRSLLYESHDPVKSHRKFEYWDQDVARWLEEEFPNTALSAEWSSLPVSPLVSDGHYYDDQNSWIAFRDAVQKRFTFLGTLSEAMQQKSHGTKKRKRPFDTSRVFLVHGHDEAVREKVARYPEKLNLVPVILHEQPNKGRTIIEKFTDYADVVFAVVLLTDDDIGGPKGSSPAQLALRARPNVLFELGYFIGALGREHVCALHEAGVEILSDYSGVLYIPIDSSDAWRLHLAKEIKAAGLPIDLNSAIS